MAGLDDEYDLAPDPSTVKKAPPYRPGQTSTTVAAAGARPAAKPATIASAATGAFVRGNRLVVKDGASLPDRCIKCNAPAADRRRTKRFAYNEDTTGPGAARMIPIVGRLLWIIWLIQQMASRQYVTVSFCVCKAHQTKRLIMIVVMALGMLAGIGLIAAAIGNQDATLGIVGGVVFIVGAVCGTASGLLSVANGLHNGAELTGCGRPFLESMPKGGVPGRTVNMYGR
jgi:hypothetical protein